MTENRAATTIPPKKSTVKVTRPRSKKNQCRPSASADIRSKVTIHTSIGLSSRADVVGDRAESMITGESIEQSNTQLLSTIGSQTSRSAHSYLSSLPSSRKGTSNSNQISAPPLQCTKKENDGSSVLTAASDKNRGIDRSLTNNRSDPAVINGLSNRRNHSIGTINEFNKKQKNQRKATGCHYCPCSRLCIFCSILATILLATVIAAALISVLGNTGITTKMTTDTSTTTSTVTTLTTTTTTTETTTITYVPTGIYALQIPTCATWNQTGITVAGNANGTAGSDAKSLRTTVSVFIDNNYTLYVCDRDNHRIMKYEVNATIGVLVAGTGVAGNGPNELAQPKGVAVDQMGAIIVADSSNYRIQRFPLGSLVGTTITANSSNNLLGQTRDLHIDVNNGVYVTDSDYSRIVKFYPNNGIGVILAGSSGSGSAANQLLQPFGNFMDGNQTLYIADYGNHRVQKWPAGATSGITVAGVTGSAGTGLALLDRPIAIAVDNNGYVYIADYGNDRIVRWTDNYTAGGTCIVGCTGSSGVAATQLNNPRDIKFDASGNIYVSDQGNNRVQKFLIQISSNCSAASSG